MVLIEILPIRVQKANRDTAITSSTKELAIPIKYKENTIIMNEINNGIRLLNFETSHPEIGSPMSELIGITNNKFPNSASLKSKFDLIEGIREAQVAKPNPNKKK